MLILYAFMKAWMIGIALAAPLGPIGMLCIRKTFEQGLFGALAVGGGAALADSLYAAVVGFFSLSTVSHFLARQSVWIKLIGGSFLLYLSFKEMRGTQTLNHTETSSKNTLKLVLEVFLLTLTNPMTAVTFVGIFAGLGGGPADTAEAMAMVIGVFCGSMTWWLILGGMMLNVQHKLPETWLNRTRYASAIVLGIFGIMALISGIRLL